MSDHTNLPTCDWCLRPLAPDGVSWDNVDDPEGYCWGDEQQGCACDDAHEEAWPKMLAEVARLRGLLGDLEWEGCPGGEDEYDFGCPCCKVRMGMPHAHDCRLAAALGEKP